MEGKVALGPSSFSNRNGSGEFPSSHLFPDALNILQSFTTLHKFFGFKHMNFENTEVSLGTVTL